MTTKSTQNSTLDKYRLMLGNRDKFKWTLVDGLKDSFSQRGDGFTLTELDGGNLLRITFFDLFVDLEYSFLEGVEGHCELKHAGKAITSPLGIVTGDSRILQLINGAFVEFDFDVIVNRAIEIFERQLIERGIDLRNG